MARERQASARWNDGEKNGNALCADRLEEVGEPLCGLNRIIVPEPQPRGKAGVTPAIELFGEKPPIHRPMLRDRMRSSSAEARSSDLSFDTKRRAASPMRALRASSARSLP